MIQDLFDPKKRLPMATLISALNTAVAYEGVSSFLKSMEDDSVGGVNALSIEIRNSGLQPWHLPEGVFQVEVIFRYGIPATGGSHLPFTVFLACEQKGRCSVTNTSHTYYPG
jgi:hypothetical protein